MASAHPTPSVMVVEDRNEDFFVLERMLQRSTSPVGLQWFNSVGRARSYIESLDRGMSPLPAAIVLDLNLPDGSGRDVLQEIRVRPRWQNVPVVVFSSSENPDDRAWCHRHGASAYQVKGYDFQGFKLLAENLSAICSAAPASPGV